MKNYEKYNKNKEEKENHIKFIIRASNIQT